MTSVISLPGGGQIMAPTATGHPMLRISEILETSERGLTAESLAKAEYTDEADALAHIAEILAMADAWVADRLPLWEVMRSCTPYQRFLVFRNGPRPTPPNFLKLVDACIDVIVGPDGHTYRTPGGCLTERLIAHYGGTYAQSFALAGEPPTVVIRFPAPPPRETLPPRGGVAPREDEKW